MSANTPNQPGGGYENVPPNESHGDGRDPLANNPYSVQYRQAAAPDLDANAPVLRSSDIKRLNRRALAFLAAIVALLLMAAFWLMKTATSHSNAPKPKSETVVVPEAPQAPPPLPPQRPIQQAIPLVATPPLPMPTPEASPMPLVQRGPSLVQRRIMGEDPQGAGMPSLLPLPGQGTAGAGAPAGIGALGGPGDQLPDGPTSAQPLTDPDTLMLRGTFIRCVLQTRIITDFPGYASCIVTEPVYSFNGRRLLLPKGSKVLGKYSHEPTGPRVAVIWDRIVTPNGIDVNMTSPGVDDLGGAGYTGHVDSHWGSRIGAALLISMLSDAFSYEAAEHGPRTASIANGAVVETPFQSNTATTLQNLAGQAVRSAANRPATVTINQGTIVDIYVAKDVDFSGVVARF